MAKDDLWLLVKVHPTMGQIQSLSVATSQQPRYAGEGPGPPRRLTDGAEASHQKDLLNLGRKDFHDWCSWRNAESAVPELSTQSTIRTRA